MANTCELTEDATAIAVGTSPTPMTDSVVVYTVDVKDLALRVVITGSPLAGKRELAEALAPGFGASVRHTDETMTRDWSAASEEVATWFDAPGPWVIEGVASPRALRKWLASHPEGKPCDQIVVLERPRAELSKGQETMRKGIATVWAGVRAELEARGVSIETR